MIKNKHIGFDLDGVIYQFIEEFDEFAKKNGHSIDESKYSRGLERDVTYKLLGEFKEGGCLKTIKEYDYAKHVLRSLENKGNEISFITARTNSYNGFLDTKNRVKTLPVDYNILIFSRNKGGMCRSLGIDYFVEDNLDNAKEIIKNSPYTKVILIDKPYNQAKEIEGITRINKLEDILE